MSKANLEITMDEDSNRTSFKVTGTGAALWLAQDIMRSVQQVQDQIAKEDNVEDLIKHKVDPKLDIANIMKVKQ